MRVLRALGVSVLIVGGGCQSGTPIAPPVVATVDPATAGPSEVELSDPKFTLESPEVVRVELHYKFSKGTPCRFYALEVAFPGTENRGLKMMDAWELKPEGSIKTSFTLSTPPIQAFEVTMSEASTPQTGYKPISNVLTGRVE